MSIRWYLLYHSPVQVSAGYVVGLVAGSVYFTIIEFIPLYHPSSPIGRIRSTLEDLWTRIGGVGGWQLGGAEGGWGEGRFLLGTDSSYNPAKQKKIS